MYATGSNWNDTLDPALQPPGLPPPYCEFNYAPSLLMTISEQDKEKLESGLLAYVIGSKTPQQYLDHDGVLSVDVMSVSKIQRTLLELH